MPEVSVPPPPKFELPKNFDMASMTSAELEEFIAEALFTSIHLGVRQGVRIAFYAVNKQFEALQTVNDDSLPPVIIAAGQILWPTIRKMMSKLEKTILEDLKSIEPEKRT